MDAWITRNRQGTRHLHFHPPVEWGPGRWVPGVVLNDDQLVGFPPRNSRVCKVDIVAIAAAKQQEAPDA